MQARPPPAPPPLAPDLSHCAIGVPSQALCVSHVQALGVFGAVVGILFVVCCGLVFLCRRCCCRSSSKKGHAHDDLSSTRSDIVVSTPAAVHECRRQPTPGALTRQATMPRCRSVERAIDEGRQRTDDALPDGWQEHTDGDGNTYFFHLSDRRMSWSRPRDGGPAAAAAQHSQQHAPSHWSQPSVAIISDAHRHTRRGERPATQVPPLPAGWDSHYDAESGCEYFSHAATGRSEWVPPTSQDE